jgi:hypothetical protein
MVPTKPFPTFKWRWLCLTPTEGLLEPEVFLGVLRVLHNHEGQKPSSSGVIADLGQVATDTGTTVDLSRTGDRNLIRNSGQYWKGTGLMRPTRGVIELTNLGRGVADGKITLSEFIAVMIEQTILPNPWTYSAAEISNWKKAGLQIRPLELILAVISETSAQSNPTTRSNYLTPEELIKVVIPLSGIKMSASKIANYVLKFRSNQAVVKGWPDCAPVSNDKRFAREFILFLSNFGILRKEGGSRSAGQERFYLDDPIDSAAISSAFTGLDMFSSDLQRKAILTVVRHSNLPSLIDRRRVATTVLDRKGQEKFRKDIIKAYMSTCFLTGEKIPNVLEAAHIIPVTKKGDDEVCNGICLRVDVHRLFDLGGIRITPAGQVVLSDVVASSPNYQYLPKKVTIPPFVKPANLHWRISYL